jgi:Domain of unknown function (DUF4124)
LRFRVLKAGEDFTMLLRVLVCAVSLVFAAGAAAQAYRWVDKDGKVRYGDTPPPGVNARALSAPSGSGAPAATPDAAAKGAAKAPLTPAEQEKEFRKRQVDAQKSAAKSEQEQKDAQARIDNCNRAQTALRTLESGQRVMITDKQGERYYLNEEEIERQTAVARQQVSDSCK